MRLLNLSEKEKREIMEQAGGWFYSIGPSSMKVAYRRRRKLAEKILELAGLPSSVIPDVERKIWQADVVVEGLSNDEFHRLLDQSRQEVN